MLAFLSVALTVYGAMHFYALSKVWLAIPHSAVMGISLTLIGIVLTLSPLLLWQLGKQNWHGAVAIASWLVYGWLGFVFLYCCYALLFDIARLLSPFLGFRWTLNNSMLLLYIVLLTLSSFVYGLIEASQIKIEKISITTPKLPSGKITIAQISDMHLGAMLGEEFLQRVVGKLNQLQPDIIVATGDVVDGQGDDFNKLAQGFHALHPPDGLFAITGNHEYFAGLDNSLRFLRNAGFTLLRGEAASAGGLVIAGVDDPTARAMGQESKTDLRQALASVGKSKFVVLLKHQPVIDSAIPFDLQLSGHVHGGQIFPFGFLTRLTYGVRTGLSHLADGRQLYVSRGTGTWGPPIRIFAAPEITLITITSEIQ